MSDPMIKVGMGVTLPDDRQGRVVRFSGVIGGEWEAEVVVDDDPDPYVIQSISTVSAEHAWEERGLCNHCDIRFALLLAMMADKKADEQAQ